jgi:hypothetical protein
MEAMDCSLSDEGVAEVDGLSSSITSSNSRNRSYTIMLVIGKLFKEHIHQAGSRTCPDQHPEPLCL